MSYQFEIDGGGEQSYDIIADCKMDEIARMVSESSVDLVAVMDAECVVVMITTPAIAALLIPFLNDAKIQPLEGLNYIGGKVPEDVLEGRRMREENGI